VDEPQGAAWERLESQIAWYDKQAARNQLWYKTLKVGQIVIAAAIPVVAAAGASAAVAGGMGALVVVAEGLQQLFQFQQNWTSYRSCCEALKREKYLFLVGAGDYRDPAERERILAERVELLVSDETSKWAMSQTQRPELDSNQRPTP
jgi:uncharacterized protein DUF4231